MNTYKKLPATAFIRGEFTAGRVSLPPVAFTRTDAAPVVIGKYRFDDVIKATWGEGSLIFVGEIKRTSTPKEFLAGIALFKTVALPKDRYPLLITPFLSPEQLQELEREGINGVDLCGNGVINVVQKITVVRTGQPNRFPSYAPIKNIYRKNSSLVGRVFFSIPRFSSVNMVVEEIAIRDRLNPSIGQPSLTLGTVSKVLAGLEQDLIIDRSGPGGIALIQPGQLLDNLARNFIPSPREVTSFKVKVAYKDLPAILAKAARQIRVPIAATGLSSVGRYAVMEREEKLSVYCPAPVGLLNQLLPVSSAADRFPNLEIIDSQDATVYFDAVEEDGLLWASPLQTYLELMAGDKRDQETAQGIRERLIRSTKGVDK